MVISRTTNPASAKWRTAAVFQNLQLSRETPFVTNRDISLATDNNTVLHQPGYQLDRTSETVTKPIPNSRLPINNSDSQKCMLPFKFNTEENSYHKKNFIQNELCYCLNEDHVNKDTEICGINLQKENNSK